MTTLRELTKPVGELIERGLLAGFKVETEAEGADWQQIGFLQALSAACGLSLTVKVGGCEARTDLLSCRKLGITSVTAPMVESAFAVTKFRDAISDVYSGDEAVEARILIETVTAIANLDEILMECQGWVSSVNFGRTDMAASLSHRKDEPVDQDSDAVVSLVAQGLSKASRTGFETIVGGRLTTESVPLLSEICASAPPTYVETRRMVLFWNSVAHIPSVINHVLRVERLLALAFVEADNRAASRSAAYVAALDQRLNTPEPRPEFP